MGFNPLALLQAQLLSGKGISPEFGVRLMGLDMAAIHVDRPLTQMIVGYVNRDYVADECMPVVPVSFRSNLYFQFNPAEMLSVAQTQLASQRGMPHEITSSVAHDGNYSVKDNALVYFVSADETTNADAPLRPLEVGNRKLHNALALAREIRVATAVFGSGNYGTNTSALVGGQKWDQFATSDPVQDIENALEACLVRPNVMVIGGQVWPYMRNHPRFRELILSRASTASGDVPMRVNEQLVAESFGLKKVIIARAKYASQVEGHALTQAYVWGKHVALIRVEEQPSIEMTACFGYTFRFGSWETRQIPEYLHGVRGGTFLKQSHSDDEKVVGAQYTSYLYRNVVV